MKYFAHISLRLQTLCSFSVHSLTDFAYKSAVTNPMFIFTVISVAQTLCSFSFYEVLRTYKSEVTNPMFVFSSFSDRFRIQICGYKPYVHFHRDFRSISFTNLRLQTLCSCFERFLQYFAYKSEVTNPMFVVDSTSYKSEVPNLLCVFSGISLVFQ